MQVELYENKTLELVKTIVNETNITFNVEPFNDKITHVSAMGIVHTSRMIRSAYNWNLGIDANYLQYWTNDLDKKLNREFIGYSIITLYKSYFTITIRNRQTEMIFVFSY